MAINGKAVLRVIIEGEWIWVERGSFTVVPLEFCDDDGNVMNASREPVPAYYFVSTQGDPYFGPLSSISLFKLDYQAVDEAAAGSPTARGGRPQALPEGSGETFGGVMGPRDVEGGPGGAGSDGTEGGTSGEPAPRKRVPLFAEDVVEDEMPDEAEADIDIGLDIDDDEEPDFQPAERRRRGGLF